MRIIDADKFLSYLIFSKHIDGLTRKEVKEAIEMCKVDVLDKIRKEVNGLISDYEGYADFYEGIRFGLRTALKIIDKHSKGRK